MKIWQYSIENLSHHRFQVSDLEKKIGVDVDDVHISNVGVEKA